MITGSKDVDFEILNKLDDKDLIVFCSTSSEAKTFCEDQTFWQRRVIDRFGKYLSLDTIRIFKADRKWSDYYIELATKVRGYSPYEAAKALEYGRKDIEELLRKMKGTKIEFIKLTDREFYRDEKKRLQGKYKFFWRKGQLREEGDMLNGLKIGKWVKYFPNGNISTIQNYNKKSEHDGEQFNYYFNGELNIYELWENGVLLKRVKS